ncbi:MAG: T9SS type A sorting domain-containing protein [Bacteroidetes bacterium]|nr:T9SS type A sorting domain-containing protein [Bacteroidota bacterium]
MKNFTFISPHFIVFFGALCLSLPLNAQECRTGGCAITANQYPSATQSTSSSTFVTVSTAIYAGEWQRYSVTSGNSYEWSLCSTDGGSASYDSQLTLYQDNGTTTICYSDDVCGDDAKIGWTATFTGFVRTQVNQYNCATNSISTTLVWRQSGTSITNDNCSGATNLTPTAGVFTNPGSQNSAGATSSGVAIPLCSGYTSSSALDVWYKFTTDPTGGDATVTVVGGSGFDPVVQCLSGSCASPSNISCVDLTTGGGTEVLSLTGLSASTTYFLRVYGWAGGTGTFTLNVAGTALPLELSAFTGSTEPACNRLKWETLSEKNVQYHIVERSVDGTHWTEVGRKAGQTESHTSLKYELEDRTPPAKAYYRLRSVDFDGQENLSNTIVLTRKGDHFAITAAFPSPANDQVTVQFASLTEENVRIAVMDLNGRLVLEQRFDAQNGINEVPLQIGSLQSGVYLVRISNATTEAEPVRIVKE